MKTDPFSNLPKIPDPGNGIARRRTQICRLGKVNLNKTKQNEKKKLKIQKSKKW